MKGLAEKSAPADFRADRLPLCPRQLLNAKYELQRPHLARSEKKSSNNNLASHLAPRFRHFSELRIYRDLSSSHLTALQPLKTRTAPRSASSSAQIRVRA